MNAKALSAKTTRSPEPIKLKITVTIKTTVDPEWIDYVVNCNDLFVHGYCGHWARGMARTKKLGWLVFEMGDEDCPEKVPKDVLTAWRAGWPLPKGWHRFDTNSAVEAWKYGVERDGVDWYENGDANTYDNVMQLAVLGEIRYG